MRPEDPVALVAASTDPVLALRLRPPAPPVHAIERASLRRLWPRIEASRLVVFCAPAGFGKSTAMQQLWQSWAAGASPVRSAWVTLDDADNDVNRLMDKLGAAWQALCNPVPTPADERGGSAGLMQALATANGPLTLFLDDLEALRNPVVLDLVADVLEHLPPGGRLVLGTREQPRLNLAALRGTGQLTEIGVNALRLSLDEAQALLRRYPRPLSNRTIAQLHTRTEGWITALHLAAHTLQDHPAPEAFATAFSGSNAVVADYLMECVVAGMPARLREFVLLVGLLEEFDAVQAAAVTGLPDADALLQELVRRNLFVLPLDDQQRRFRFHALFVSFLRAEAVRRLPDRVREVHEAASRWFLREGCAVPAIHHALAAGAQSLALDLLEAHAEALLLQGRARLLARWFDALGAAVGAQRPALVPMHACALAVTRRQPEALRLLDQAEARRDDAASGLPGADINWLGAVRGLAHAMLDQPQACLEVSLRHHDPAAGPRVGAAQGMLANALANALLTATRFDEAMVVLTTAKRWHWSAGSRFSMTIAECVHAGLEMVQGRLPDAEARLRSTLAAREPDEKLSFGGGAALGVRLAATCYGRNRITEARRLLRDSLPYTRETGPPDVILQNYLLLARCARAIDEPAEAQQRLAEMEHLGHATGLQRLVATAWLERARLALCDGEPALARDYLAQAALYADVWQQVQRFPAGANDVEDLALGQWRWTVRAGQGADVLLALRQAVRDADHDRRRVRAAVLRMLLAEVLLATGQARVAHRQMQDVVAWCAGAGQLRLLLDEAAQSPLLRPTVQAWAGQAESPSGPKAQPGFFEELSDALGYGTATSRSGVPAARHPDPDLPGVPSLSAREARVLHLLASGKSNREIAAELFISENTVKAHLRSLNGKLDAGNRTRAVARARQLGLLDPGQ